jgi:seryl-tRNA synthetase
MATSFGAREVQYPVLISREALERAEYQQAFPHLLMSVCRPGSSEPGQPTGSDALGPDNHGAWCLSPAVCYHTYAQLAGQELNAPTVVTARGRCFRAERETTPGVRQIEFEMRELVCLGPADRIETFANAVQSAVETVAIDLGLPGRWETAEDPFFLPAASGKALLQRLLKLKVEYQWPGPGGLALASVNRHGTFFGQRFNITTPDGRPAHSACVAVGLDRWAHHAQWSGEGDDKETTR